MRLASGISGVPIRLDLAAIPNVASTVSEPVGINMENTTVGEMLRKSVAQFELEIKTDSSGFLLTVSEAGRSAETEMSFGASDLIAQTAETPSIPLPENASIFNGPLTMTDLLRMLTDLSRAETGKIRVEGEKFLVRGTKTALLSVEILLERMRHLRHLEPTTDLTPGELIPETLADERLSETMSLHFLEPVPLRDALAVVEEARKIIILFDAPAARAVGVSEETPVRVSVTNQPVAQALTELLEGLHLTFLALSEKVLLVTSQEEAARRVTVEVVLYAIPGGDSPFENAAEALEWIRTSVEPESWAADNAPVTDNAPPGRIWADPVSGALLIRQTSRGQSLIRRRLAAKFEEKAEEKAAEKASVPDPAQNGQTSETPKTEAAQEEGGAVDGSE